MSSPPHTPHGSARSTAPSRQVSAERALAADGLGACDVEGDVREEEVGEGAVTVGAARGGDARGDRLDELVERGL
jgi:hypothetical protein